ncbi:MAG: copper transporter [Streptosporangiaceae bacterium]|nr:copper transporter [Streptosporangiaceae bacterium]
MIDFRYHLVSIVAVFLALAIGIVLGSTELQGPAFNILNQTTSKLQDEWNQARSQLATTQAQLGADEAYAAAVEPAVLHDLLTGQRLLLITEPGSQPGVVGGITSAAQDAGAEVTGQIALQPKFFDTSAATQQALDQTTLNAASQAAITLEPSQTYAQQAAQLLATEILTKAPASPGAQQQAPGAQGYSAAAAQAMLAAYAQSGFLTISGQPSAQATLAVVITPQTAPSDGSADPLGQLLVPLAEQLAAKSSATVVAGSSAASGPGSPIGVLRTSTAVGQVSTVDDADFVSGQTVAIQALAAQLNGGKPGNYGLTANGASAAAPSPVPTPSGSAGPSATATPAATKNAAR